MQHTFFVSTDPAGAVSISPARPASLGPARDYSRLPVQISINHDLTMEVHGENFSTTVQLTWDDVFSLISRLAYGVREQSLTVQGTPIDFLKVTK